MGRIITETIRDFSGGQSDDIRLPIANQCGLVKHFNIFNSAKKLIPHRSTEADTHDGTTETGMKQYDVRDFVLGSDGKLYGLGKVVATGYPKVVSKADPTTGNWTLNATAEGGAARITGCFIEWQGAFWMFSGTTNVSKWVIGSTFTDTVATVGTITTVAQGIVGADDNLYLFYNNKVVRVTPAGAVSDNVLTALPSNMRITCVARYGSYLAIGMAYGTSATASPTGVSKVFIWDMVTDTTVSDVIDWGDGSLMVLGNLEGRLVGISDKFMSSALGVGQAGMVIRMWSGGLPVITKEVIATQTVTLGRFLNKAIVKDNKLYWVASVPFGDSTSTESTYHLGIWCYGRKSKDSEFALSLDFVDENIDTANFKIMSFGNAGNYWFINHSNDGSITKTNDAAAYTFDSIYETQKFGGGKQLNKLIGVSVATEPLSIDGQVTLKYKSNQDISSVASPGTMANTDGGGGAATDPWSDVDNAMAQDDAVATCTMGSSEDSDFLDASNFGFSIPTDAVISGIKVEIDKYANVSSGSRDKVVQLIVSGTAAGTNKGDTSTNWANSDTDVYTSYGGSNDLWGNTLTPAIINASNFGVRVQASALGTTRTVYVDHIKITVYFRSTWTTIFTNTTDNSLRHEAVNIESSGETLPSYKEIEFRLESTGGAEILEFSFKHEEIDDNKY